MKLKQADYEREQRYKATAPKQLGNLHERMQFLMSKLEAMYDSLPQDVWHAACDLETEVAMHEPAKPPYGKRTTGVR